MSIITHHVRHDFEYKSVIPSFWKTLETIAESKANSSTATAKKKKKSVRKLAKIQLFMLLRLKAASERKLSNFLPLRPVASFWMAPSLMQFSSALGKGVFI